MAKTAVAAVDPALDFEAIDRLEQKLKQLVGVLDRTRTEQSRAADELTRVRAESARTGEELTRARAEFTRVTEENAKLRAELDAARGRAAAAEGTGAELTALRQEREQIKTRVGDMLKQIEALNL